MHSFFIMLAMVAHKSVKLSVNCLDVRILFQPSASIPEGPEPPFVLSMALRTASALILSYLFQYFVSYFFEYFQVDQSKRLFQLREQTYDVLVSTALKWFQSER